MQKRWNLLKADPGKATALQAELKISPVLCQVLVQRGLTYGRPVEVIVAAAQPAIFEKGGIVDARGNVITPGNAAKVGDPIAIFCAGLGEVSPRVQAGDFGPPLPGATVLNPVAVSIGNVNATVQFAGLAPMLVGVTATSKTGT